MRVDDLEDWKYRRLVEFLENKIIAEDPNGIDFKVYGRKLAFAEDMYMMLKCIYGKRLIPENWKNHYKELEELIDEIDGKHKL